VQTGYDVDSTENVKNKINDFKILIWINDGTCWRDDAVKINLPDQCIVSYRPVANVTYFGRNYVTRNFMTCTLLLV
jgi:hypothetical protein